MTPFPNAKGLAESLLLKAMGEVAGLTKTGKEARGSHGRYERLLMWLPLATRPLDPPDHLWSWGSPLASPPFFVDSCDFTHGFRSGDQLQVSEVSRVHNPRQGVREDVRVVAVVVPPFQLFQVAVQVLCAHLVEGTDDGALEQAPHALDAVGMNVTHDPLFGRVVDHLMASIVIGDAQVGLQLVGVDRLGLVIDGPLDKAVKRVAPDVGDALHSDLASALDGSGHPRLVALVGAAPASRLSTDHSFVHLHYPYQRGSGQRVVAHRFADAVAQIPGRLVRYSQGSVKLVGRHALLGHAHQVDGQEPRPNRQVGVVHDSSRRDAELVAAGSTLELSPNREFRNADGSALQAGHAMRPSDFLKRVAAFFIATVTIHQGNKIHGSNS